MYLYALYCLSVILPVGKIMVFILKRCVTSHTTWNTIGVMLHSWPSGDSFGDCLTRKVRGHLYPLRQLANAKTVLYCSITALTVSKKYRHPHRQKAVSQATAKCQKNLTILCWHSINQLINQSTGFYYCVVKNWLASLVWHTYVPNWKTMEKTKTKPLSSTKSVKAV